MFSKPCRNSEMQPKISFSHTRPITDGPLRRLLHKYENMSKMRTAVRFSGFKSESDVSGAINLELLGHFGALL